MNLDPAGVYSDDNVWKTLELTNLKTYVSSLSCGLQSVVEESGSNFRQVMYNIYGHEKKLLCDLTDKFGFQYWAKAVDMSGSSATAENKSINSR